MSAGDEFLMGNCSTGSGDAVSSNINCYNTAIDASQIVFGLAINSAIGFLCYIGFVVWRGEFRVYFNRLVSPFVPPKQRPPPLKLGGHHQLWSWLIPVFRVSDGDLLRSAGLDALVAQRILGFGCLALLPLSILGVGVLIPVTYSSYEPATTISTFNTTDGTTTTTSSSINDEFLRMTMSAVPSGSNLLLVHFFFTYIYMGWVCWLLVQYYKEFISLRQAHDHRLLETTELGKRNSLLEETLQPGSSQQIAKYLRLSPRRSSFDEVTGIGGGVQEFVGSEKHISVRFSDGVPAGRGSVGEKVMPSGGSTSSQPAAVDLDHHSTTSDGAQEPAGEAEQQSPSPSQPPQQVQLEAGCNGRLPTGSGVGLRQQYSAHPSPEPSPFDQASSGRIFVVGDGGSSLEHLPSSGSSQPQSGSNRAPMADLEQQGHSSSSCLGQASPMWDELAEPLPLVASADAAQFYTVLIIDAPVEEFIYSHTDSPWVWHMPTKLAATPRLSLEALEGFVTKGKSLARLTSVKERQRLEHRHRRMQVAEEAYTELFGKDFDRIVPLYNTSEADGVIAKWWDERDRLDRLLLQKQQLSDEQLKLEEEEREELGRLKQQIAVLEEQIVQLAQQAQEEGLQPDVAEQQQQQQAQGEEQHPQQQVQDVEDQNVLGQQPEQQQEVEQAAAGQQTDEEQAHLEGQGEGTPVKQPWRIVACCSGGKESGSSSPDNKAAGSNKTGKPASKRHKRKEQLAAQQEKVAKQLAVTEVLLATLQSEFEEAQLVATEAMPAACFFATFRTAQAAAQASRLNLNPLHERMMRAMPAPAPNNVNYTTMLHSWMSRGTCPTVVAFFVLLMIIFPMGMFAGVCGTIVSSACGGSNGHTNDSWFCSDDQFASLLRNSISSTLPSILLSVWQAVVLPLWFYTCAQAEALHFSFTALDLRCAHWFFLHDILNVFLGGMLGGSIMWGLRALIDDPSQFFNILGQAAPASSNFFINYVSYRALAMTFFRLFFPHAAVFGGILKWLHIVSKPKTERDKEAAGLPINCRYSRDLGVLQLTVFVVCLAYAIVSPLIVPFGLLYFLLTWPIWRYQMLYVYQSHYDCKGQFWIYCAHRVVICLGSMSSFTSAVLATKGAYAQGVWLFSTSIAYLWWFDTYLTMRYDNVVDQVPAVGFLLAPRARVDDRLYVPPPMRPNAAGWTPEWGKAWTGYGVPRYGF